MKIFLILQSLSFSHKLLKVSHLVTCVLPGTQFHDILLLLKNTQLYLTPFPS